MIAQAAEIYADLYRRVELIGDTDILIVATSMVEGLGLATNYGRHVERIEGLHTDNGLRR
jgi:predicted nucleic acid-binding protein